MLHAEKRDEMSKYVFTEKMREISGFGGGYEQACRDMVVAGLEWLDANPSADPKFHGYKNVYGLVSEDNEDAKNLSEAICAPAEGCSGAMHQAAVSHVLWIRANGWEAYVKKMESNK